MYAQSVTVSSSHLARCQTRLDVIKHQVKPMNDVLLLSNSHPRHQETPDHGRASAICHLHFTHTSCDIAASECETPGSLAPYFN